MPVSISEIRAKNLGPISDVEWTLGRLNVIYGRNEEGKTSLVEFLLRSLFRSAPDWTLRNMAGPGQVMVEGLDASPVAFSPDSKLKLEDFWDDEGRGYPPDLARLLVVKGAELEMVKGEKGGIDRSIVRHFLSQIGVLKAIKGSIQPTVYDASIAAGLIEGPSRGEIKQRLQVKEELEAITDLLNAVNDEYTSGRLAALQRQEQEIQEEIQRQEIAKRHLAFQLQKEQEAVRGELQNYPPEELDALEKHLGTMERLQTEAVRKEEQADELADAAEDFEWLKHALEAVKEHPAVGKPPSFWLLVLAVVLLLGGAVAAYFQELLFAVGGAVAGIAFAVLYAYQWSAWQQVRPDEEARSDLREAFCERFDREDADEPAMRAFQEELREQALRHGHLLEEIEENLQEQREVELEIHACFRRLDRETLPASDWLLAVRSLRGERTKHAERDTSLEIELARLGVAPEDVVADDVDETYDAAKLKQLEEHHDHVQAQIQEEEGAFREVQANIRQLTGADAGLNWNDLLQALQSSREEKAAAYKEMTARIIAQILTAQVIEEMLAEEDDNIKARLQSDLVKKPLRAVTGRYEHVDLDGDQLVVADAFQSFPMAALSTGAQEQVLLALRMAFAAQLLGDERLFLILDDAFQYADWERREWLVNQMVELGKNGWQILYFTMDDHLLGLFEKRGKRSFKDTFQSFRLPVD